jgi:predicted CXXCH cytochrome family protein
MKYSWLLVFVLLLLPASAIAAGGHDMLGCTGCHSIHDAKAGIIFVVEPNKTAVNPADNKPFTGVTALCLGCHETTGGMGILPVTGKKSHPYGVKPNSKIAGVPGQLLRNGKLECTGCHDPHPSNPYNRYLRVSTKKGTQMQKFCSLCHASKSGVKVSTAELFDSMDERAGKKK